LESDKWGVLLMVLSGHDPNEMMAVMDVLEKSGAGGGKPEFMSSHPRPANRRAYIKEIIAQLPPEVLGGLGN
jgi:predicted Zn-dependent protease